MLQICCKTAASLRKKKKQEKRLDYKERAYTTVIIEQHPLNILQSDLTKEKRKPTLPKAPKISFKDPDTSPFGGDYPREGTRRFVPGLRSLPPVIRGSQHGNKRRIPLLGMGIR